MTEEELVDRFGFSRMTINKALNNLSNDGFIERKPGKGTYVCATRVSKPTDSARSFTEDMKAIGLTAGSKLISYEVIRAHDKPEIAQRLELSGDELLHYFIRLRTGNGKPIAISYNYVSAKILPAIDVKCLEQSFYAFLDSQGIKREYQGTSYTAKLPTAEQQELLEANDIALLCASHSTFTRREGKLVPFGYTLTCYNGNLYTYYSSI